MSNQFVLAFYCMFVDFNCITKTARLYINVALISLIDQLFTVPEIVTCVCNTGGVLPGQLHAQH